MKNYQALLTPLTTNTDRFAGLVQLAESTGKVITVHDLETTGLLTAKGFGITEFATLHVLPKPSKAGQQFFTAQTLVDPENAIPKKVIKLTGITNEMVTGLDTFEKWLPAFNYMYSDKHLVLGFNSFKFDVPGVLKEGERYGRTLPEPKQADIYIGAKALMEKTKGKLADFAELLGVTFDGDAHRALADTMVTAEIASQLVAKYGVEDFLEACDPLTKKKRVAAPIERQEHAISKISDAQILRNNIVNEITENGYHGVDELISTLKLDDSQGYKQKVSYTLTELLRFQKLSYDQLAIKAIQAPLVDHVVQAIKDHNIKSTDGHFSLSVISDRVKEDNDLTFDFIDLRVAVNTVMIKNLLTVNELQDDHDDVPNEEKQSPVDNVPAPEPVDVVAAALTAIDRASLPPLDASHLIDLEAGDYHTLSIMKAGATSHRFKNEEREWAAARAFASETGVPVHVYANDDLKPYELDAMAKHDALLHYRVASESSEEVIPLQTDHGIIVLTDKKESLLITDDAVLVADSYLDVMDPNDLHSFLKEAVSFDLSQPLELTKTSEGITITNNDASITYHYELTPQQGSGFTCDASPAPH